MFFSVIIPLYNKEDVIVRTLKSVASQDYTDYELIVVNDGSTDHSYSVVKELFDSAEWLNNNKPGTLLDKPNAGVSSARNYGAQHALGDYVAFLDADDQWSPYHLSDLKRIYQQHPDVPLLSTVTATSDGRAATIRKRNCYGISPCNIFDYPHGTYPLHSGAIAIRRNEFLKAGGYDTRFSFYEDRALYYKLSEEYGDFYVNWNVSAFYLHDAKWSINKNDRRPYTEYGYLIFAEERLQKGLASGKMQRCVVKNAKALFASSVLDRQWNLIAEFVNKFPCISSQIYLCNIVLRFFWLRHIVFFGLWIQAKYHGALNRLTQFRSQTLVPLNHFGIN